MIYCKYQSEHEENYSHFFIKVLVNLALTKITEMDGFVKLMVNKFLLDSRNPAAQFFLSLIRIVKKLMFEIARRF